MVDAGGANHSQSLESLFMSVQGLDIIAPSICQSPGKILENIINSITNPTIFVEYKTDYSKKYIPIK